MSKAGKFCFNTALSLNLFSKRRTVLAANTLGNNNDKVTLTQFAALFNSFAY